VTLAVLDASALMALMLGEPGAEIVEEHLDGAYLSTVNLAEVVAKMLSRGAELQLVRTEIEAAGIETVALDEAQALRVGELHAAMRRHGLSLGDRACLALAAATGRIAVTGDRPWADADVGVGVEVRLIR